MGYDKDQAAEEFARWSESYDRCVLQWMLFGPSHRVLIRRIQSVAGDEPCRVLDVGCGTGLFASRMRAALPNAEIWGVDLVSEMLARGAPRWRFHAGSVQPIQGDSERLPFASDSFDFVTCANSFHHYPHQDRAVAEMQRVLRPGGRLLFCEHGRAPDESVRRWQHRLQPLWGPLAGGCRLDVDVPALLTAAGFDAAVESRYLPGPRFASYHYWGVATVAAPGSGAASA